jgi:hypothetical protein
LVNDELPAADVDISAIALTIVRMPKAYPNLSFIFVPGLAFACHSEGKPNPRVYISAKHYQFRFSRQLEFTPILHNRRLDNLGAI